MKKVHLKKCPWKLENALKMSVIFFRENFQKVVLLDSVWNFFTENGFTPAIKAASTKAVFKRSVGQQIANFDKIWLSRYTTLNFTIE